MPCNTCNDVPCTPLEDHQRPEVLQEQPNLQLISACSHPPLWNTPINQNGRYLNKLGLQCWWNNGYNSAWLRATRVPYRTPMYHPVPYRAAPYRTVPYRTVPYRTVPMYQDVPYWFLYLKMIVLYSNLNTKPWFLNTKIGTRQKLPQTGTGTLQTGTVGTINVAMVGARWCEMAFFVSPKLLVMDAVVSNLQDRPVLDPSCHNPCRNTIRSNLGHMSTHMFVKSQ